jgi:hypothetical protein
LLPSETSRQILMRVSCRHPSVGFMVQPINRSLLDFEAQTKKRRVDFDA